MADNISSISSSSNNDSIRIWKRLTLSEKIEQIFLKNNKTDINSPFKTYEGKDDKFCIEFTSKTYTNFLKMNSIEIKENSFHDIKTIN